MSRRHRLAFAFGGGGARGALQVGALRALVERGWQPDFLVGTSVGAVNAAFFALDPTLARMKVLEQAWREAAKVDLFPAHWAWLATRVLLNRARVMPAAGMIYLCSAKIRFMAQDHSLLKDHPSPKSGTGCLGISIVVRRQKSIHLKNQQVT